VSSNARRRRTCWAAIITLAVLAAAARPSAAAVSLGGWMAHSPDDLPGSFTTLLGNDVTATIALPFTFTVEGVNYTTIVLSSNGWIEFGSNTSGNSDPSNDCLPTSAHTNPFVAMYWDDLNPFGTSIRHGTVGSSPNRVFIADYEVDMNVGEGSDDISFQVQLHERSNTITVRYRNSQANANGQGATIGFQGAGGASATTVQPLVCNGKILDDNRPDEGWSADVGRLGQVTLAAMTASSPDDISGFATLTGDDATVNVTMPFSVTLEGTSYSAITISTNGWIEFGGDTSGGSDLNNGCLPVANHTHPLLAAYWDDLVPFGTNIRYGTVGQSPNRVFIADYEVDLFTPPGNEGSDDLRFQVQIHERSSLINVRYRDKQSNANGQAATIGFQGAGGASAKAYPLTCNGKILDDNDETKDGWSIHPKGVAMSPHSVLAFSPDDINATNIPGLQTFSGDDVVQTATMPFSINIDGVAYSQVAISTNGWLEFGGNTAGNSTPVNACLPTSTHTNPFFAAFWDDMVTAGGSTIKYGTVGQSPNRTFLVDFFLDTKVSGDDGNDDVEVHVLVHEGSSTVSVKYREAQLLAGGQTATLGFQGAGGASASTVMPIGCNARVLDDNINDEGWSIAPLPICGNGINESLGNEQCDQGGSNGTPTSCCTGSCGFRAGGSTCRVGGGAPCDLSETCTGSSATCPADDAPGNSGITCRLGSGDGCDPDELCNGTPGVACPGDVVTSSSTVCRTGSGDLCDPDENCPGVPGAACPANVISSSSTVCRPGSGDACDANETCSGLAGAPCPNDDAPFNAGVVCRGGSGDLCDLNESCTGTPGATCPPDDAPSNAGVVCRPSSADGAFCDEDETCTGAPGATCPPNDAPGKINVVCRTGSGDLCDPDERCTGITGQGCPADVVANPTVVCRTGSGDSCDPDETCTAIPGQPCPSNTVTAAGTVCRSATGSCDVAEECTGTAGQPCPANVSVAAGTGCEADADLCTDDECNGSGACVTVGPVDCDDGNVCTQDSCNPLAGCEISGSPSTSCLPAAKAKMQVKDSLTSGAGDRLKLGWQGGPVLLGDLGDPINTTRYELCIYDNSGIETALGIAPGAGWNYLGSATAPKGYKYKNVFGTQAGVKTMSFKASSLNKAKLKVSASGDNLPDGILPLEANVIAQIYAGDGMCWEATFGPAETKRTTDTSFIAKSPAP
jgi:hypothetical protein